MEMDERFAKYLLGELRWEVEQQGAEMAQWRSRLAEDVSVTSYTGYFSLRFRCSDVEYAASLSWRGDVAPTIVQVSDEAERGAVA